MIILDTHIWVWWTDQNPRLAQKELQAIQQHRSGGVGVSSFSLWEIAKLHEKQRLKFSVTLDEWFKNALARPNVVLLHLSPRIITESIKLPGNFHSDPADQVIVATARVFDCPLVTYDAKILNYKHVKLIP